MILGKLGKPSTLSMYAKLVWLVCASAADNGAGHSAGFYSMATFKRTSDSAALLKALTRKKQKASAWSTARWAIRCLCTRNNTLDKYLTKYLPLNESDEQNEEVSRGRGWSGIAGNLWPGPSLLSPGGWTEVDLEVKIPQPASHQRDALIWHLKCAGQDERARNVWSLTVKLDVQKSESVHNTSTFLLLQLKKFRKK